jgi:chromosome segregation ATPase
VEELEAAAVRAASLEALLARVHGELEGESQRRRDLERAYEGETRRRDTAEGRVEELAQMLTRARAGEETGMTELDRAEAENRDLRTTLAALRKETAEEAETMRADRERSEQAHAEKVKLLEADVSSLESALATTRRQIADLMRKDASTPVGSSFKRFFPDNK